MESNKEHPRASHIPDIDNLRTIIQKEKEELVTMFLSNASLGELAEQFKRIDELNNKICKSDE